MDSLCPIGHYTKSFVKKKKTYIIFITKGHIKINHTNNNQTIHKIINNAPKISYNMLSTLHNHSICITCLRQLSQSQHRGIYCTCSQTSLHVSVLYAASSGATGAKQQTNTKNFIEKHQLTFQKKQLCKNMSRTHIGTPETYPRVRGAQPARHTDQRGPKPTLG